MGTLMHSLFWLVFSSSNVEILTNLFVYCLTSQVSQTFWLQLCYFSTSIYTGQVTIEILPPTPGLLRLDVLRLVLVVSLLSFFERMIDHCSCFVPICSKILLSLCPLHALLRHMFYCTQSPPYKMAWFPILFSIYLCLSYALLLFFWTGWSWILLA